MKKLVFILFMAVLSVTAFAQKGAPLTFTGDTVQGAETIYVTVATGIGTSTPVGIQALCTQLGGTTDGTLSLQGSVDGTNFVAVTDQQGLVKGYPNDSLTMTNGASQVWLIEKSLFTAYRLKVEGTSADTTLITGKKFFPYQ